VRSVARRPACLLFAFLGSPGRFLARSRGACLDGPSGWHHGGFHQVMAWGSGVITGRLANKTLVILHHSSHAQGRVIGLQMPKLPSKPGKYGPVCDGALKHQRRDRHKQPCPTDRAVSTSSLSISLSRAAGLSPQRATRPRPTPPPSATLLPRACVHRRGGRTRDRRQDAQRTRNTRMVLVIPVEIAARRAMAVRRCFGRGS